MIKEKKTYTEARRIVPSIKNAEYKNRDENFPPLKVSYAKALTNTNTQNEINEKINHKKNK